MRRGFYRYTPPDPEDYDSEEEYQRAVEAWESAEEDGAEEYVEQMMELRHRDRTEE